MLALPAAGLAGPACGPTSGVTVGDTADPGSSSGSSSGATSAPTGGPIETSWSIDLAGCGGLRGLVVLPGGDIIVAGERAATGDAPSAPFVGRYDASGATVWERSLDDGAQLGAFEAIALVGESQVIAVGRNEIEQQSRPMLAAFAVADGAIVWIRGDEPPGPGGLYGATWSIGQDRLWTTGWSVDHVLVAGYDAKGGLLVEFAGPSDGFTAAAGFAATMAGDDIVACGRVPTTEGGELWLARYSPEGALQWTTTGPDPGVGAFSDCWDVAAGADQSVGTAERGYHGARVGLHDAAGALRWEYTEPNAGALAIDIDADGEVWVAGFSAAEQPEPPMMEGGLRSHSEGDRHGWVRRFGPDGADHGRVLLGVTHVSPRDIHVHPDGGVVLAGEHTPVEGGCPAPWIARAS